MFFSVFLEDIREPLDERHISKKKKSHEKGKNREKDVGICNEYRFLTEKWKGKCGIMNLLEVPRLIVNLN